MVPYGLRHFAFWGFSARTVQSPMFASQ